tara:strand:+ start:46 stop:627 length:582 start_codon:yes stop_codon:yes gene_type:complete
MGGTILKYIKENKSIIEVIFTHGQLSHPHLKEEIIIETRKKEAEKVARKFGIKKVIFLNLNDSKIKQEIEEHKIASKIKQIIKNYNPEKIFTLSSEDTHQDHRTVNQTILKAVDSLNKKYSVFTFQIWGKDIKQQPKMFVDISPYFKNKIKMIKLYESQIHFLYPLLIPLFIKNKFYGIKNHCKYAERFQKIR